jgi:predicted transposase YbfD/YdcC
VLAQIAADAKSNEITAVPKLLAMLRLEGLVPAMTTAAQWRNWQRPDQQLTR